MGYKRKGEPLPRIRWSYLDQNGADVKKQIEDAGLKLNAHTNDGAVFSQGNMSKEHGGKHWVLQDQKGVDRAWFGTATWAGKTLQIKQFLMAHGPAQDASYTTQAE